MLRKRAKIENDYKLKKLHQAAVTYSMPCRGGSLGLFTRFTTKGKIRHALYMGLTYMRWLDDIADESEMLYKKKLELLKKQLNFLKECRKRDFTSLELSMLCIEQRCAYFFIKDCIEALKERGLNKKGIEEIIDTYFLLIKSILIDTENQNKVLNEKDFYNKVYYTRAGGFRAYAYAFTNSPSKNLKESFKHFGYMFQRNNDHIDIADDLKSGIINFTRQEIKKYNIDMEKYKSDYSLLVDYLASETTFFEDRAKLLKKWKKIIEKGIPEMPFFIRILMRRYLEFDCPKKLEKPGTIYYETRKFIKKEGRKSILGYKGSILVAFFVSRRLVYYLFKPNNCLKKSSESASS